MNLKKLLSLFLALVISVGVFVSCDKDGTKKPAETTPENSGEETTGDQTQDTTDETVHVHAFGEWVITTPATCTEEGVQEHVCACGEKETVAVPKTAHTEVIDDAVPAICTKTGLTEGKHCSVCDTVLAAQTVVPKTPHTEVADAAVASTCTKTGLTAGKHCSVCGTVTVKQTETPKKAHKYTDNYDATCNDCGFERDADCRHTNTKILTGTPATCTQSGLSEGKVCLDCEEILVSQETLDAIPHTEVVDPADPATCNKAGLTEGKHCSVCGHVTVAQQVDPIKPHDEEIIPGTPADYGKTGLTDGKKCKACGTIITPQEVIDEIPIVYHTITYKNLKDGATVTGPAIFMEHLGVPNVPEATAVGWTFIGWYTAPNGQGTFVDSIDANTKKDVNLYAHWEIINYEIVFYDAPVNPNVPANSGKANTRTYTVEDRIVLADPEWSGLVFVGWYEKGADKRTTVIEKGTTGDIELWAHWTSEENLVVPVNGMRKIWTTEDEEHGYLFFIYEIGEIRNVVLEEIDSSSKKYGETLSWETGEDLSFNESVGETVSKATVNAYSSSFEYSVLNGYSFSDTQSSEKGFKLGIEFKGVVTAEGELKTIDTETNAWERSTTDSEGETTTFEESLSNTSSVCYDKTVTKKFTKSNVIGENMPAGEYTYVYRGTVKVYAIISYDSESGECRYDTYSTLTNDVSTMILYSPPANSTAHITGSAGFAYTEKDAETIKNQIDAYINNSYFVQYDGNGATSGEMPSEYYEVNTQHTLSENIFVKPGYTWINWKIKETGKIVGKNEEVSNLGSKGQTLTALAQWVKNNYTIVYNGNKPTNASGSVSGIPGNIACKYDESVTLGVAPTLNGWTFVGWYKDSALTKFAGNAGQIIENANLVTTPSGTITLYAKWSPNTYTLSFDSNGGTSVSSISTNFDQSYGALPTPTKSGYAFVGWYYNGSKVTANTINKNIGNHTLTAKWAKSYATYGRSWDDKLEIDDGDWGNDATTFNINTGFNIADLIQAGYTRVKITVSIVGERYSWINYRNNPVMRIQGTEFDLGRFEGDSTSSRTRELVVSTSSLSNGVVSVMFIADGGDAYQILNLNVQITAMP